MGGKHPGGHSFDRFELDCIYMASGTPVDLEKETNEHCCSCMILIGFNGLIDIES
jgi:hypothetical protein